MAKQLVIPSAWIILLVTVTSVTVNWATQAYILGNKYGVLGSKVENNATEIKRIDVKGSTVVQNVQIDITKLIGKVDRNESDIRAMQRVINTQYNLIIEKLDDLNQ